MSSAEREHLISARVTSDIATPDSIELRRAGVVPTTWARPQTRDNFQACIERLDDAGHVLSVKGGSCWKGRVITWERDSAEVHVPFTLMYRMEIEIHRDRILRTLWVHALRGVDIHSFMGV